MASAAPAAGTTPPPPIARFYQNTDNKDAAGLPVFNWSMVRAVPFGKQKQASTNGYEGYPIMPNVLGDRENTFFGVDDGGGASGGFGGGGSASVAPSAMGGGMVSTSTRKTYEKTVPNNEKAAEWEAFMGGFKAWFVSNWDIINENNPNFNAKSGKKFDTDKKRLNSIERRLRGPLKEKSMEVLEKYPRLRDTPFTSRYKILTAPGQNQTQLCVADTDGNMEMMRDPRTGKAVPRNGSPEDVAGHCDVMETWCVHIIQSKDVIDLMLIVRQAIAYREAAKVVMDWSTFGGAKAGTIMPSADTTTAERVASFAAESSGGGASAAAGFGDDTDMGGGEDDFTASTRMAVDAVM
jgi:hypothetical protein